MRELAWFVPRMAAYFIVMTAMGGVLTILVP